MLLVGALPINVVRTSGLGPWGVDGLAEGRERTYRALTEGHPDSTTLAKAIRDLEVYRVCG